MLNDNSFRNKMSQLCCRNAGFCFYSGRFILIFPVIKETQIFAAGTFNGADIFDKLIFFSGSYQFCLGNPGNFPNAFLPL